MVLPVSGVSPVGAGSPLDALGALGGVGALGGAAAPEAAATSGADFAGILARGLESVQAKQSTADDLAVQAATGTLTDVHDYTIAATEASLATELVVSLRNKAVEAFTEVMRMQV